VHERPAGGGPYIFSERLMQNRLVQAQVGDQPLELAILLAELAQFAKLADAELAADLADRRARLGLARRQSDLARRETCSSSCGRSSRPGPLGRLGTAA